MWWAVGEMGEEMEVDWEGEEEGKMEIDDEDGDAMVLDNM